MTKSSERQLETIIKTYKMAVLTPDILDGVVPKTAYLKLRSDFKYENF